MRKGIIVFALFFLCASPVIAAPSPLTLSDYWQGKAVWKPVFALPEDASGNSAAAQVVVVGQNWYLFNRHINWSSKPDYCAQNLMTLEVRKSTDSGKTWTAPVDILTNTPGSPQECAATDGGTYYTASTNTWHILYQCLGDKTTDWAGCHATRVGADPIGPFTPDPVNPVTVSDDIWKDICNSPADKCVSEATGSVGKVIDAGTFDIFQFDGTYYWITFHGFDGKNGFRGMAKTQDFHTFIAGDANQGIPTDAILTPTDLTSWNIVWNGQPVGFGDSRIIKEGNYFYQIADGSDVNLGATIGNHWGFGLFRSTDLSSSSWQQPTVVQNPIASTNPALQKTDSAAVPGYNGLFRDATGTLYMHTSQSGYRPADSGIFFFRLFNPADSNEDGKVDINDFNQMRSNFGKTGTPANLSNVPFSPSDLNNDGKVDIFDYDILVGNYGK